MRVGDEDERGGGSETATGDRGSQHRGWSTRVRDTRAALAERRALGRAQRHNGSFPTLDQMLSRRLQPDAPAAGPPGVDTDSDTGTEHVAAEAPAEETGARPVADQFLGESPRTKASASPGDASRFGRPGQAFNRSHPFYVGFVGALGVFIAYGLVQVLGQLQQVITLLVVSLFLALGLEPVVDWLTNRRVPRGWAITGVFGGVVAVFAGFGASVVPILVDQGTELVGKLPDYLAQLQRADWFVELDQKYDLVGRATAEVEKRLGDGQAMAAVFGGVLGAGQAVLGGVFSALTVLILTLYFLASMRHLREAGYALVPASRRTRVQLLGDEISKRIGGYVIGQLVVASLNGVCSYVMMLILGIPYPAVLAIAVGLIGLLPLVGATIGAVLVVVVALFVDLQTAVIVLIYYIVYQQVENYLIAPKIMARTVSVPGAVALVAALIGATLMGAIGALIGIPIAAGILLVVQEVVMPRQDRL